MTKDDLYRMPQISRKTMLKMAEEMKEKERAKKSFFESKEFENLLGIIRNEKLDKISDDDYNRVCDTVYYFLENTARRVKGGNFPHFALDYRSIRFHIMIGQGCEYWTESLKNKQEREIPIDSSEGISPYDLSAKGSRGKRSGDPYDVSKTVHRKRII